MKYGIEGVFKHGVLKYVVTNKDSMLFKEYLFVVSLYLTYTVLINFKSPVTYFETNGHVCIA